MKTIALLLFGSGLAGITGADRFGGQAGLPDSGLSYSTATRKWAH